MNLNVSRLGDNIFRIFDDSYWIQVCSDNDDIEIIDSFRNNWKSTPETWKAQALEWFEKNKPAPLTGKLIYVRAGKPPESGYSYNYRDNVQEHGISCYRAFQKGKSITIDLAGVDKVSALFILSSNRDWYVVKGEVVGKGSDGEPCLSISKFRKVRRDYEIIIK